MASPVTAAASAFSLLHSSSARSTAYFRLAYTFLPSLRRLGFAGTTADLTFSGHRISNLHLVGHSSAKPIDCTQSTTDDTRIHAAIPTREHLIKDGAKGMGSRHSARKNVDELTCQLLNVRSKSRWTPLSKVPNPGFATGAVPSISSRSYCSHPSDAFNELQGPAAIDYRSVLQEDEFHKLADSTIHDLLEKLEQYGDSIDLDGFDIDYGNEVLTLKLGDLGTYVVNKQTPNRQIWLSSPVSGPSRYDWDRKTEAWIYRRTRANLLKVLESEIEELCGKPLNLS